MSTVYTIGHSNRTLRELIDVLRDAQVELLVDIRALPKSARFPQFDQYALTQGLGHVKIAYQWAGEALGGRRESKGNSPHHALDAKWHGYAEHMSSKAFREALGTLIELADTYRVAALCAEKRPEECHRALLSDALQVRGVKVVHLIEVARSETAKLDTRARLEDLNLIYDSGSQGDLFS